MAMERDENEVCDNWRGMYLDGWDQGEKMLRDGGMIENAKMKLRCDKL